MTLQTFAVSLLNGLSYGLLLFMLSSGLTLIFSMMGVLNFAHASFYMLGAYVAYQLSIWVGFWPALVLAPAVLGVVGALIERYGLRRVRPSGHIAELLFTFAISYVLVELVQLAWGRSAMPYRIPPELAGSFRFSPVAGVDIVFPEYRAFMVLVSAVVLLALWLILKYTRTGLIVRAALSQPQMLEALGHDVPRVFTLVFAGGVALAGLAGVIGGNAFVTEPAMAGTIGAIVFVVIVIGGMGSLAGALLASLTIGLMQSFAVGADGSLGTVLMSVGIAPSPDDHGITRLTLAQFAPVLPYLLMVAVLVLRPRGLLGTREG